MSRNRPTRYPDLRSLTEDVDFVRILADDVATLDGMLRGGGDSPHVRRNYVRAVFAEIDGLCF